MRFRHRSRHLVLFAVLVLAVSAVSAQPERKRKKPNKNDQKEPITQTLPALPDPPAAVAAETARLVFHVSPLSAKGLLSQQVRDALKALDRDNKGSQIVKLRAFVAGTGDMRRVQQIASEVFSEKRQPLPAISTIQVGALPLEGAQVVIESTSVSRNPVNPSGLIFLPPQSIDSLQSAGDVLRATCFLTSFGQLDQVRAKVSAAFPGAVTDFVQLTRFGGEPAVNCDAVARPSGKDESSGIRFTSTKIVMSGLQMSFRDQESDIRLAFDRLKRSIEPLAGRMDDALISVYPLTRAAGETARRIHPNAGPVLLFEGLPALDAVVGLEVVAARTP